MAAAGGAGSEMTKMANTFGARKKDGGGVRPNTPISTRIYTQAMCYVRGRCLAE